ncbi:MAG: glycosyl hydrolases family 2 immunoglobulin-like beta-sandwich domain protein [Ignavibacteria bacterium]|nr:MAG: glycosyl hydrolases family 2 immunoglobulin-like beta-sandwich domain protein [Ignavibacteria bacterium]KAF0160857.1 MAG: glycosyl hydrolases family 2 immunoglobulin-like beta-sandwich domain protein [Ignavibacteria bacterium]
MRFNENFKVPMKTQNGYNCLSRKIFILPVLLIAFSCAHITAQTIKVKNTLSRERISLNEKWFFYKYDSNTKTDDLIYDVRPEINNFYDGVPADTKPTEAENTKTHNAVLKPWILPSGNDFIKDISKQHTRPDGNPGKDFSFVQKKFDDKEWEVVNLPHDWAIKGPFYEGVNPKVGGGMGRLPSHGVAWYRKKITFTDDDKDKSIFLDVDGAMSYAIVWLNGNLVGGWPYGYSSWRLDLTSYILPGEVNQLAIRLDNPNNSSRWYPGGGIYRNVWLTKTNKINVAHLGTFITTPEVSKENALIKYEVTIDNDSKYDADIKTDTQIFALDENGKKRGKAAASFEPIDILIAPGESKKVESLVRLKNPKLWGPHPTQTPNLYAAVTTLWQKSKKIDEYETKFGIRSLGFDPKNGLYVNDELIKFKGVNQHHDLGALGAAFNTRAAERQLEILQEMGCNAIRMAHNPPAPELLELTDKMGFLVVDEVFDSWILKKTPYDFHLIFPDWYEQDLRAMIRRDRNNPSVVMWSYGNEVGEQYTDSKGAAIAKQLHEIIKEEDTTRPTTSAMNWAKPDMPFPEVMDVIGLNYQGEGIRQSPEFEGTERIRTAPQYSAFFTKFPDKVIYSAETASAASSRGVYLFPVTKENSSTIRENKGGDSKIHHVSSYELYAVDFGSSADKVFASLDKHPFVAGEFVWNGFDYIGEPTPYYDARSSYTGIIDLAGFKKDRFYLYQSRWRTELPMAHIIPHWNWQNRLGEITPVHVFTSGNEAELFLNGNSLGKKMKAQYEYRLRWDDVKYEPGELKVIAYKNGKKWSENSVRTTGEAETLEMLPDRNAIYDNGKDLAFITIEVKDKNGLTVPTAENKIKIIVTGGGELAATDNGDPTNFVPFPSNEREAFSGMMLAIVRSIPNDKTPINITAKSNGLIESKIVIRKKNN